MAIEKEIWQEQIEKNLYAANPHLGLCSNADQYVLAGKVVHIPQSGSAPGVEKNRMQLPAKVTRRTDTDVTYAIDEYTSDPIHIKDAEKVELSYNKRASVLEDTQNKINETVGVCTLKNWAPTKAVRIIRTTGEPIEAHMEGAKGMRKRFTLANLKASQKAMNKDNFPSEGRYAIFDADMYDQLTDIMTETQYRDFSRAYDEKTGIVGKLFGFNILSRSFVLKYNGSVPVEPGTEGHAPDCAAILCWHTSAVEKAQGDIKFFEDVDNPLYFGDIYSALVRLGGRIRRENQEGVVAIVQDLVSVAWATGTTYKVNEFVTNGGKTYVCLEAHNASAAFATDAAKWEEIV